MTGDDTTNLSDADLWEHLVKQGKSEQMATALVMKRRKTEPFAGPAKGTSRSFGDAPDQFTPGQQFSALAGQGATLGFGAKVLGGIDAVNAMLPKSLGGESLPVSQFGQKYSATRDRIMDAADEGVARHPVAGPAVEIASGVATSLPMMGAKAAVSGLSAAEKVPVLLRLARNAVSGAQTGAKIGAVAGAGHATGGVGDYVRSMANSAAGGGIAGGVIGAAVPEVTSALGSGASKAVTALGLRPSGRTAEEMAADAVRMQTPRGPEAAPKMGEAMNGPGNGPPATPTIRQRIAANVGRAAENAGIESSKTRALRELMRRLELDNVTPENAVAFAERHPDKPVAMLDVGEGNVAGLARTAKDVPSLARRDIPDFLHGRSAGTRGGEGQTLQRITSDFEKRIGLKPENYFQTADDMAGQQKAEAATNYGKVRGQVVNDEETLSLFAEPEFRAVHEAIRRNARLRGGDAIPELVTKGADGTETLNPQTLGTLDKMKRHLDQIIGGKIEGGPIQRDAAYAMRERLNTALDRLDEQFPDYRAARSTYRGSAELQEAFENGKKDFLSMDPRLIERRLASMPERVQELYRRGAYDALRGKMLTMEDGANVGGWLEKNPDIRARVQALAKSADDASLLRDDLGLERHMGNRKAQILGGPNTAERLIEHESTVPRVTQVGELVRKLPGGNFVGALVDNQMTRRMAEQTGDVMGEVGKLMTRSGPEGMRLTAEEIRKLRMADLIRQLQTRGKASVAGGLAGTHRDR